MIRSSSAFLDSKRHFLIPDALRGVAAIVVVLFHVLEVYSNGDIIGGVVTSDQPKIEFTGPVFPPMAGIVALHGNKSFYKRGNKGDLSNKIL